MHDDGHGSVTDDEAQVVADDAFGLAIQCGGGFIEYQDVRVGDQRSGDGDVFTDAAGDGDVFTDAAGDGDVFTDAAGEQAVFLRHHADLSAQSGKVGQGQVDAVDDDPAALRHVEALHQLGDGAFAGAGTAD